MRKKTTTLALAAAAVSLTAMSAGAASFIVLSSSTLNDVRAIGGTAISNLPDYTVYSGGGGTLNVQDPSAWTPMDASYGPSSLPNEHMDANNINVNGTLSLTGGSVSAAVLNQLGALSMGLYQTDATRTNLTTGDPTKNSDVGGVGMGPPMTSLTWTYNPGTNVLVHNAATTNSGCVVAVGGGPTGSCSIYRSAITGATAGSVWNWDGLAANYAVKNTRAVPWGTGYGCAGLPCAADQTVVLAGATGTSGVTWNLNGCTEASLTCTIYARVVGSALSGNNATAISGLYTLQLQNEVPVPAAVWLFGGALGALGMVRRRQQIV